MHCGHPRPALWISRAFAALVLWFVFVCAVGCATYTDRTDAAREFAAHGNYDAAIGELDEMLGVEAPNEQPEVLKDDSALLLLERAMLHQARGDYEGSRQDLLLADKELELLDFSNTTAGDIASYLYSDDAGVYKVSPVERLSLNALNILNFLALGDLTGARVEAKRFQVMRKFLQDTDPEHAHGAIGSYLAGFVYEQLGDPSVALRYYDEALEEQRFESLVDPIRRLAGRTSYRGPNIAPLLEGAERVPDESGGEILVVAGIGRVPYKVPERIPIGAVVGIVAADVTGDLSVLDRGAFKVLVFPGLVPAVGTYRRAAASIDAQAVVMEQVTNFGTELVREYEEMKPKILAAGVTRMISRAVVAEGARLAGREAGGEAGQILSVLAGLVSEGLLVAADKPDTRSWTLLPERVLVSRRRVTAGPHEVTVRLGANGESTRQFSVDVPEGGYAIVVVMPLH
ncbi:MAG: hypothetical protein GY733_07945 [bacterium]|nr:hypothetical protein [bacterium]